MYLYAKISNDVPSRLTKLRAVSNLETKLEEIIADFEVEYERSLEVWERIFAGFRKS